MLSHNQTKLLTALQVKKYRQKYRKFVVEGDKMVAELLAQQRVGVSALFATAAWIEQNAPLLSAFLEKTTLVSEAELKKISTLSTPNAVLAVAEIPPDFESLPESVTGQTSSRGLGIKLQTSNFKLQTSNCFYLDGLQDPGNVGTILRTADWFGMPAVFCSPDCADVYSPKVVQASMGAVLRIHTAELPLAALLAAAPDTPVMGAVLGGQNVFEMELPKHGLIVIGNEGRGISPESERLLTHRLTIPRHPQGRAESLNAAVAAGILAARICRGG